MKNFKEETGIILKAMNRAIKIFYSLNEFVPQKKVKISISDKEEAVTNIDIEINNDIATYIAQHFSGDIIIGEENPVAPEGHESHHRFWLIDPIDGTRSLIDQVKGYSTMIAFVYNGKPTIGCIWDSRTDEIFIAIRGRGIYLAVDQEIEKFIPKKTCDLKLLWNPYNPNMLRHRRLKAHLLEKLNLNGVLQVESCGLRGLHVAKKEGAVMLSLPNSAKIWDTAASQVFINEAGGTYTNLHGVELSYTTSNLVHKDGAIATMDFDHEKALNSINSCLASTECFG